MTGDVLPCFDAFKMTLPEDAASIVTVPITLDIASNHGVIVTSKSESLAESYTVSVVNDLLQKPTVEELVKKDAILHDGRTLLDTGIISARGRAWLDLVALGCSCQPMILELIGSKKEVRFSYLCSLFLKNDIIVLEQTLAPYRCFVMEWFSDSADEFV